MSRELQWKRQSNMMWLTTIRNSFHLLSYFLITYFFLKLFKTDFLAIQQARIKIKLLTDKRNKLQAKYHVMVDNNIRGERTSIKKQVAAVTKEIKQLAPKDKIDHFNDLLSKL